jgi:hypothetical protein
MLKAKHEICTLFSARKAGKGMTPKQVVRAAIETVSSSKHRSLFLCVIYEAAEFQKAVHDELMNIVSISHTERKLKNETNRYYCHNDYWQLLVDSGELTAEERAFDAAEMDKELQLEIVAAASAGSRRDDDTEIAIELLRDDDMEISIERLIWV